MLSRHDLLLMLSRSPWDSRFCQMDDEQITDRVVGKRNYLGRVLSPLGMPADVLVYSVKDVEARGHLPGTALCEALSEGKILYDVAS